MKPPNIKAPKCTLFSTQYFIFQGKGHKGSLALPWLLASIVEGSLLRRAHFESLRVAEAKTVATINQYKYRTRSCITKNIALRAWSRANKVLGCASRFIGSRPRPHTIFLIIHCTSTSILFMYIWLLHKYFHLDGESAVQVTSSCCYSIEVCISVIITSNTFSELFLSKTILPGCKKTEPQIFPHPLASLYSHSGYAALQEVALCDNRQ